jgi:DNA-binding NarL/FixJ family response regulator
VGSLLGREAERARARGIVDSSARGRVVRALRIVGPSGVGKTALAEAVSDEAAAAGWLVVLAPSFRIHASLQLFTARRVVGALVEALGEKAERYRSGLTIDRDRPAEFEEAFLRMLEGVVLDYPLLLVLDDAQWADAESRSLIERAATALADRAVVLLSTERSDETNEPAFALADEAIALGELPPHVAVQIVRELYPGVSDDVAAGIASETHGRAVDIVAVATAARESAATTLRDVSASTRRVVARDLSLLDARVRTFLQICALLDDPIELPLLQRLWPKDELFEMIEQLSGRYLVSNANGLRFVHATIMESILETIPIEIPLRHRIIDMLKKLPSPRIEDYERIAKQSAACGDRETEREALTKLSEAAAAKSLFSLSVNALERSLAIGSPPRDEIVPTYVRLSQMYNVMARYDDVIRVCRRALTEADAAGVSEGLGSIAASIVLAQWHLGLAGEARATLAHYEQVLSSSADRANLASLGEYIAMHRVDVESAREYGARYDEHARHAHVTVAVRHEVTNAFLAMRLGDEPSALERIKSADRAAENAPAMLSVMPLAAKILHAFRFRGVSAAQQIVSQTGENGLSLALAVRCQIMIARGQLTDVEEIVVERLQDASDPLSRRGLLSARYTAAALQGLDASHPAWQLAQLDVAAFEAGERAPAVLPAILASLIPLAAQSPARAEKLLALALEAAREPVDTMIFLYPVLLANAAQSLHATDALEAIAAGTIWTDRQPWNHAQHLLAQGVAASALGRADSAEFLATARERFMNLGAMHFVGLAAGTAGNQKTALNDGKARPNNATRRECEIAGLVADGLTNREIAERLVLSERTVEGHIANLFAKVNVNSRTQLATWFMRTVSSVA